MNTEQERAEFESWRRKHYDYDDLDAFEIEFAFDAYKAGRAAKKQALEEMEAVGYQERIIDKEWNRPVCDWYPISKELYESPRDIPETCRMRYETRILYATKEGKQ